MNNHPARPPILVVEEDLALRTSLTYQIRKEGYAVLALGNAALAREVVRENPLSLLVLDPLAMTKDECALCREIRANPLTERLPILLLVNREREITQIEQMGLGVTDYLLKPLAWDELRACLRALMRGCGQGKPHRQARSSPFPGGRSSIRVCRRHHRAPLKRQQCKGII